MSKQSVAITPQLKQALEAGRGIPPHPKNPECALCEGNEDGIRPDVNGEPMYCLCRYINPLPEWAQKGESHRTRTDA